MTELRISPNLTLPAEAVTETFGILAKRGVGKTYLSKVMVEEFIKAGLPVVVVDPIGVWWGLRSSADGKSAGLPVAILGGEHGDVPLEHTGGSVVAEMLVDNPSPVVIDLSGFRKGESRRFMTDFLETLYARNRSPLHVVLDEADEWAPQRPQKGAERLLGACEDLVRRGRARGIGVTLISQRPAVVNKDVLTQIEVLVAMRIIGPQDRDAIDSWIKVHGTNEQRAELLGSLAKLPIGHAWWWSPGWLDIFQLVKVRTAETFDSSATPKAGKRPTEPRAFAAVDLSELKEKMAETIERQKADDPKELRRRIAQLEKEAKRDRPPQVVEKMVEVEVVPQKLLDLLASFFETSERFKIMALEAIEAIPKKSEEIRGDSRPSSHIREAKKAREDSRPRSLITPPRDTGRRPAPETTDEVVMKAGARRILETLARHHPMRVTKSQVGTLTGFKITGGTFQTYWGVLRRAGYVEERDGLFEVTERGLDVAGVEPSTPASTEELLEVWRKALKKGAREMLDVLVAAYPDGSHKEGLAEDVGMTATGGTFQSYLGTLRRNGLIEDMGDGWVRASEALFLG